jgi:hypothetical protein
MACRDIPTSFSLKRTTFEEFGEGDQPVVQIEIMSSLVACLGTFASIHTLLVHTVIVKRGNNKV